MLYLFFLLIYNNFTYIPDVTMKHLHIFIRTSNDTGSFLFIFVAVYAEISVARIKSCLFI